MFGQKVAHDVWLVMLLGVGLATSALGSTRTFATGTPIA